MSDEKPIARRRGKAPSETQLHRALDVFTKLGRTHPAKSGHDLIEIAKRINPWIASFQMEWRVVEDCRWKDSDDQLNVLWRGFACARDWLAREVWAFHHAYAAREKRQLFTVHIHLLFSIQPVDGDSRTIDLDPVTGLRWVWPGRTKCRAIHSAERIAEWEERDRRLDALIGAAVRGAGEEQLAPLREALAPKTERRAA